MSGVIDELKRLEPALAAWRDAKAREARPSDADVALATVLDTTRVLAALPAMLAVCEAAKVYEGQKALVRLARQVSGWYSAAATVAQSKCDACERALSYAVLSLDAAGNGGER